MEVDGFVLVDQPSGGEKGLLLEISDFVDKLYPLLFPLNRFIHDNPELAYEEYRAHNALTKFMQSREGWVVKKSAFGLKTAWTAVYDTGKPGPVVSFNAEMDALPNLGHACGHNLIAMASLAAGLATASILQRHSLPGKVIIVGTPAEENGAGGKIKLLHAGAYRDVDVSVISHPSIVNNSPYVRTTAYTHLDVSYQGRAAHAANSPWLGVNALDALVIAYNAISALRQQTRPDDIIGLQITDGGNQPNVIHEHAAGVAVLRSASAARLKELQTKVEACFRAGAEATGAKVEIKVRQGYLDHVPNLTLAKSFARHWEALPDPAPAPPLPPAGQYTYVKASTDQGNLSYALPSMNVSFAIPPISSDEVGPPHTPAFEKASATRDAFLRAMRVAKAKAGTAVDLFVTPGLLAEVKGQWRKDMENHEAA